MKRKANVAMNSIVLEKNAWVLERRFLNTWKAFQDCLHDLEAELLQNETYKVKLGNDDVFPYGQMDAQICVQDWLKTIPLNEDTVYIITGFGTGFHVEQLLKILKPGAVVAVAEANVGWLKWLFSRKDCRALLEDERLILLTDFSNFDLLEAFELPNKRNVHHALFAPTFVLNEKAYYPFCTRFCQEFDMRQKAQSTVVVDSKLWQKNALANLETLVNVPTLNVLKGKFSHLPLVLVSAGPSLDSAIPFLKKIQNKALIVSMNSSFRTLCKNKIHSHLTLALDPRPTTFYGFKDQPIGQTVLVTTHMVHPDVVKHFGHQIVTWNGQDPLTHFVWSSLGKDEGPALKVAGTVANLVGDLAHFLGCQKVCLVGQDLACTESGKTHASDSIYNDNGTLFMDTRVCREWSGNTLPKVFVESKLFFYLQIFNKMAASFPSIEFINTSVLGAKIDGIPYMDYADAEKWMGNADSSKLSEQLLEQIKESCSYPKQKLVEILQPLFNFTKDLCEIALQAATWHDSHAEPIFEHERIVREGYAWADKINALIDSNLTFYQILLSGRLIHALLDYKKNLDALLSSSRSKTRSLWIENREYFWAVFSGCNDLLHYLLATKLANYRMP